MGRNSEAQKDIQELIDQKINKRLKKQEERIKKLEEDNKKLKEVISEKINNNEKSEQDISRREFLKKAGLGAAGLGALSLSPTAANLKITKNGIFGSNSQNQEIKDVEKVNSTSVDTKRLRHVPSGARLTKNSTQDVADSTTTTITWENENIRDNLESSWADLSNNEFVIPSTEYNHVRFTLFAKFGTGIDWQELTVRDGSGNPVPTGQIDGGNQGWRGHMLITDWIPVSQGDRFYATIRQTNSSTHTLGDSSSTNAFSIEAV